MRIGIFAGPAAGGAIGALFGLRAPFLVYAGLAAITAVTSALSIEASERDEAVQASGHLGPLLHVVKEHYRILATAGSAQLFAQAIRAGRHIIIPLYAADALGLDVQSVGWIVSISSFVDMCMFYPAGLVMDRFGRKFAIVPCFLTQAIGMGLIPLTSGFTGLLLASCLVGLGNGFGAGSMMTLGADLAPKDAVGEFLGLWRLIGDGGNMGGPLAVGGVADVLSLSAATLVISGVGLLAAGTFALIVPETLRASSSSAGPPRTPSA
jgi:predicted MFS family arabinose efflux permease